MLKCADLLKFTITFTEKVREPHVDVHMQSSSTRDELITAWARFQRPRTLRTSSVIGILTSASFVANGDRFIFGEEANVYLHGRFFLLALSTLCFVLSYSPQWRFRSKTIDAVVTLSHLIFNCGWLATYYFFLFVVAKQYPSHLPAILVGATIVIITLENFSHRFSLESIVIRVAASVFLAYTSFSDPSALGTTKLIATVHLVACMLYIRTSKVFFEEKIKTFAQMHQIMSHDMALAFVTGDEKTHFSMLQPKSQTCFTLISDWRNFQKLSENYNDTEISDAFACYYDEVISVLNSCSVKTQFFVDWSADQLLVLIFPREGTSTEELMEEALKITRKVATEIFAHSRKLLNGQIFYDIGVTLGPVKVGLFGPKGMMKTTGSGSKIGVAKRLETEAKELRLQSRDVCCLPIIAMDSEVYQFAAESAYFADKEIKLRIGKAKNIENEKFYSIAMQSDPLILAEESDRFSPVRLVEDLPTAS